MSDRAYWFGRNLSSLILNVLIMPIYMAMFVAEAVFDGIRITLLCNGSEELSFPWENEWPFFRGDE